MTRELGVLWARRGVRVNAIAPGYFPSEMTARHFVSEEGLRPIREGTPMGRPGREDELDGALLFLVSDAASYVTGQTIVWTAGGPRGSGGSVRPGPVTSLTWARVHSRRLARHHLAERPPGGELAQTVADACGIHAQVMSAELSLWARVDFP